MIDNRHAAHDRHERVELNRESRVVSVPLSHVDPSVCLGDGGNVAATEHPDEAGVYTVRCVDGVVLTGWNR